MAEYIERALEVYESIPKPVVYSVAALGALKVAQKFCNFGSFLYKHCVRGRLNLIERYGKDSWALVTGGGDGIGEEYCYQLAKLGFNIIVVGRSDNIIQVSENVISNFKVQSRYIKVDLANYSSAVQELAYQTKGLDISILVNNAGIAVGLDYFDKIDLGDINRVLSINAVSPVMVTRQFIPQLLERRHKSAIIFVSSISGLYACPFMTTYSATKAHIRAFSQALSEEYKDKIDVMAHCPSFVATKMIPYRKGLGVVTREATVSGALDAVGRDNVTIGSLRHDLLWSSFEQMYGKEGVVRKVSYRASKNVVDKKYRDANN